MKSLDVSAQVFGNVDKVSNLYPEKRSEDNPKARQSEGIDSPQKVMTSFEGPLRRGSLSLSLSLKALCSSMNLRVVRVCN